MSQATPFDTILTQCRDLVCERLDAAVTGMLDKADDALLALVSETREPEAQKLYLEARDKVLAQRQAIETQFRARYMREFQQRSNRVKKIGESFSDIDLSALELELVGEDDLNETLKFNAMAAKLREYCDEELVALDQRVGVLLGDASLQPEDNPFNPQAICDAYKYTCRQIDPDVNVRLVLLRLFDDHVADDIRAVYKAVNSLLVHNSILPKIRVSAAQKQPGKSPSPAAKAAAAGAAQAAAAPGGEQDLFSVLQKLLAAGPATPVAAGGQPAPAAQGAAAAGGHAASASLTAGGVAPGAVAFQGAELLRSLTRLQLGDAAGLPLAADLAQPGTTNVLRELRGTSLVSSMNQMDSMTLDIMAMLFDQLFDDPRIPIGVKGLIGRLQIPMLKVAIADKAFFSKKTHPARQMLDTLGEISARLPADFDASSPMYGRLDAILHELIDGFEDDIAIFDAVRERLQSLVAEEDQRIEQETQSSAKQVEQKENLAIAKSVAQAEIKVRIRGAQVPLPVLKFLVQEWVKYLIVVNVKSGENSEEWKTALKTIEQLVWSVEPRETHEERRALVAVLPELLKRLAAGAQLGGVDEAVRTQFFTELRKLHSAVIARASAGRPARADGDGQPEAAPAADAEPSALAQVDETEPMPAQSLPLLVPAPAAEDSRAPKPEIAEGPAIPALPEWAAQNTEAAAPTPAPPAAAEEPLAPIPMLPDLPPVPKEPVPALPDLPPLSMHTAEPVPAKAGAAPARSDPQAPLPTLPGVPPAPKPAARPQSAAAPARSPAEQVPAVPRAQPTPAPSSAAPAPRQPARAAPVPTSKQPATAESKAPASAAGPLNFTPEVTVNNPFGDGKVEVDDLDFTVKPTTSAAHAKSDASPVELPPSLAVGTWVEIREKGGSRRARLAFISPLKTRYLFMNRQGKKTLECSRAELARRLQIGELVITEETAEAPLFDRIVGNLVTKLGGPGSSS
jgi:hypothetical protein